MHPDSRDQTPAVTTLNACTLTGSGLQRQSRLPPRHRPKGYEGDFDADTLWYDAIQVGRRLQLICPKLNNLASVVRSARWRIDDKPARLQRIRFCRFHDIVELQASSGQAQKLTIEMESWLGNSSIAQPQPQLFAGLNTVVLMNKNNSLHWIVDFLRFHIYHHRLEGVILMDNGSTLYSLRDLQDAIRPLRGLQQHLIVAAPFKFGPYVPWLEKPYLLLNKKLFHVEKFLQTALLNSVHLRYLSKARAVLNCDVDELAYTPKTTIFDLAVKNPLGLACLPTLWRYSNIMDSDPTCHAAHRLKHITRPEPCHAKYCIVPCGLMRWFPLFWNLHWLEFEQHEKSVILQLLSYRLSHALNYFFKLSSLVLCRHAKFWHCRSTTTSWKSGRKLPPPPNQLIPDYECSAALDAVFSSSDSHIP